MLRPSDLLLPSDRWRQLIGPPTSSCRAGLTPDERRWLAAWERWDSACSPMDDADRQRIRYGHWIGWFSRDYPAE